MTKTLTYPALAIATLTVVMIFVTAKTFWQLAAATVLYPTLIFLMFMIFPRKGLIVKGAADQIRRKTIDHNREKVENKTESLTVADIDKRTFIKLIGATGISFFLFSLLGRRAENILFGQAMQPQLNTSGSNDINLNSSSPTDGYKISEVDEEGTSSYFGFTNKDGAWLIMREGEEGGSFRYTKGGSDFTKNWDNRKNLIYDYFHNLYK